MIAISRAPTLATRHFTPATYDTRKSMRPPKRSWWFLGGVLAVALGAIQPVA